MIIDKNLYHWYPDQLIPQANLSYPISLKEYQQALGCSYKALGPSGLTFEILKELPENASIKIVEQLNVILSNEVIPDSWITAKITLLP